MGQDLQQRQNLISLRHRADGSPSGGNQVGSPVGKAQHLGQIRLRESLQAVVQQIIQHAGAKGVSGTGGFNDAAPGDAGLEYPQVLIVGDAASGTGGDIDQAKIGKLLPQLGNPCVKIRLSREKIQLIIGYFDHITLGEAPADLLSGLVQVFPQRRAEIGVKREKASRFPGQRRRRAPAPR